MTNSRAKKVMVHNLGWGQQSEIIHICMKGDEKAKCEIKLDTLIGITKSNCIVFDHRITFFHK